MKNFEKMKNNSFFFLCRRLYQKVMNIVCICLCLKGEVGGGSKKAGGKERGGKKKTSKNFLLNRKKKIEFAFVSNFFLYVLIFY